MANQLVPSSSFTTTLSWTYDVFLSFRGEDTRTNFTDHLYQALVRHGIRTFIDHSELPIGEEIAPTLLEAIENSRISVIIFSENYAFSRWCLDELVHILECRKSKGQMTRPIFYKVDPSDVRHQRNSYDAAFAVHSRKYENNLEKVQRWRTALTEAADLKGATLNKGEYETTFINAVVEEISTQVLNNTYLHVAKYPVGMESCVEEVEELLGVGGKDRRVVGIWGTSGIGKTTIAKAVHNVIAHKFQGSCFLADVRERSTSREAVIKLQKRLLSKILCGTKFQIDSYHEGLSLIKNQLSQKKILLILDDVDHLNQLDNLVQDISWFGEGSRVIITTKDRGLLDSYRVKLVYEVQTLEEGKALELLLLNALGSNEPAKDYLRHAQRAIAYAQGLPLALNIIGSHLYDEHIDHWKAILDGYDSYDGEPYTDIQVILRKTYDAWDYGLQQVFLDIACFFKGGDKKEVLQILRSSKLGARQDCIEKLVKKAAITIEGNRILMHNLLEQMGKRIVWEESPTKPGERSRLWFHEDVYNVLTENQGTKEIRSIVVELPKSDVMIPLNPKSFLGMVNLEIFINRNAHFSGPVDYLPNSLRWIDLGGRSIINIMHTVVLNLPSNFHPRHLVKFDVLYSGIRQLKKFKNLAKLTWMNLSYCEFLEKIPNLSGSPNIKHLDLSGCKNLVEVDDYVGFLDKLVELKLMGCSNLTRFATRLGLRSLERLSLWGCTRLEGFPEIEKDKMKSLTYLDIGESGIRELPSSIAYLTGLTNLNAWGCALQNVPDLSGCLNLHTLDLTDCTSLVEVDDSVGFLDKLSFLYLDGCAKLTKFATRLGSRSLYYLSLNGCRRLESFPEIVGKMESLDHLEIKKSGIRELPSFAHFPKLRILRANGCENIQPLGFGKKVKFDEVSSCSSNLRLWFELQGCNLSESDFRVPLDWCSAVTHLNLSGNNFVSLPDCISKLVNLETLFLRGCKRLREIPVLPPKLQYLYLDDCTSLEKILKLPSTLKKLSLCNCSGLSGDEVAKLKINLLNEEIYRHSQLNIIYALTTLVLSRNNFVSLPDCISKAVNLKTLYLKNCKWLREISALPPKLEVLCLDGCTSLEKIPKLPPRLEVLDLYNCYGLSGDEVAKLENNLLNEDILVARLENEWLNEEIDECCKLSIIYPGNDVPKWFSYTSNHPTTIQPLPEFVGDERDRYKYDWELEFVGGSEFRFEIPLKLQVGETLLGLAISYVLEPFTHHRYSQDTDILINGKIQLDHFVFYHGDLKATHVRLALVGSEAFYDEDMDICQVVFRFRNGCPIKSCGVHCLLRNQDSGSSSSEDEEQEKVQPSDSDVPFDIEEDEEQQRLRQQQQQQQQLRQQQFQQPMQPVSSIKRPYDGRVNQLVQVAPKCQSTIAESGSDGISQQDLQTNSNMVLTAGRQLAKSLELQSLNDLEGLKVYPRHATAAKLQMQKMQEMEQLAIAQGLSTDRNTLDELVALHPGLNNQMNNHHQMVGPGAMSGAAEAAYQNLLLRHNSMNSNANSLQQEASSSFNNSNHSPSSTFQGAAALIPGSMQNLPGTALSSPHLPSRQPQQLQQRSLSSNSLLQQTHSTGSQGNQALQQQMIQQLLQEMSNNSGGGQQSLPCPTANGSVGRNGVSFGGNNPAAAPSTSNVPGSHGPAPSTNNSFKAPANSDNSTGGGSNSTYNQRAPDLPSNLHLQEDLVQDIAREFTENGFFNSNPDDNMYPQISSDIVLRPTSSLGKRPHPRGSSDIVDDEYDHPKRRQIDVEEEEEQEQPSASDDQQFQIS